MLRDNRVNILMKSVAKFVHHMFLHESTNIFQLRGMKDV